MKSSVKKCRVPDCATPDITNSSKYCFRHKICENHLKSSFVEFNGGRHRFCQKCTRFHEISEFDNTKHSCRSTLELRKIRHKSKQEQIKQQQLEAETSASQHSADMATSLNIGLPTGIPYQHAPSVSPGHVESHKDVAQAHHANLSDLIDASQKKINGVPSDEPPPAQDPSPRYAMDIAQAHCAHLSAFIDASQRKTNDMPYHSPSSSQGLTDRRNKNFSQISYANVSAFTDVSQRKFKGDLNWSS